MIGKVTIQIYKVTGKQLFFEVPSKICEECDLLVNMTERVVDEINDSRINIEVKPWLNNLLSAILKQALHPPILLINGKVFSQGEVPDKSKLKERILEELS
jgi:hypothetical protein